MSQNKRVSLGAGKKKVGYRMSVEDGNGTGGKSGRDSHIVLLN